MDGSSEVRLFSAIEYVLLDRDGIISSILICSDDQDSPHNSVGVDLPATANSPLPIDAVKKIHTVDSTKITA